MVIEDTDVCHPAAYAPCEFRIKWADSAWEVAQARALRRAVFCIEQGVFVGDDTDAIDSHAQTLVAVSALAGMPDQVVGTVRIHPHGDAADGLWWGSRLAVHAAFRRHGHIGATLIRLAVGSAQARGCRVFLAHIQAQNVPLFRKLGWTALKDEQLHGRPHALMQADLAAFPPCHDPRRGYTARSGV
jgi:putative N-acetyltransferase (TIGR04045 family)